MSNADAARLAPALPALLDQVAALTPAQIIALNDSVASTGDPVLFAPSRLDVPVGNQIAPASVAWRVNLAHTLAAQALPMSTGLPGARAAVGNAAAALVARPYLGQGYGLDQDLYDQMTGPWRTVVGQVHAGDTAPDEVSSASRQHFIDTGYYVTPAPGAHHWAPDQVPSLEELHDVVGALHAMSDGPGL